MSDKAPKSMKDPVMIAGNWEERNAPPITAGRTRVPEKDRGPLQKEDLKGKKFLKREVYLKETKRLKAERFKK